MKKILVVMLLLCLWQGAVGGVLTLKNGMMGYTLKFAITTCGEDGIFKIKKSVILKYNESAMLTINLPQQEILKVAYDCISIFKRSNMGHYRDVKLPDDKDYVVEITNLPYTGKFATCTIKSAFSADEPNLAYYGPKSVGIAYTGFAKNSGFVVPSDVLDHPPGCLGTFNNSGALLEGEIGSDSTKYKHSRVSLVTYDKDSTLPTPVSPEFIMEFSPERINYLPRVTQKAIAAKFTSIDLSRGLCAGLINKGVERIYVTVCCFGLTQPSTSGPSFNVIPFGFTALDTSVSKVVDTTEHKQKEEGKEAVVIDYSRDVLAGLFESNGIGSCSKNPIAKDTLNSYRFLSSECTKDDFGCQLLAPSDAFASCCFVFITPDLKSVLVSHVLIANSKKTIAEISPIFSGVSNFKSLLSLLIIYTKTHASTAQQALARSVDALETMSTDSKELVGSIIDYSDYVTVSGKEFPIAYSGKFKSQGDPKSVLYFGIDCIDKNKRSIRTHHFIHYTGTETVLVSPCTAKDKVIVVQDGSKWKTNTNGCIAFNIDSSGTDMPNFDVSSGFGVESVTKQEEGRWEITLTNAIGKDYLSGTAVREHFSQGGFIYSEAVGVKVPDTWTTYKGLLKEKDLFPGTTFIRMVVCGNNKQTATSVLQFKDIDLK